ncbi:MAG: hypothetical protein HYV28_21450 [Ignavibacteriales bacterium]|nr:hypothetical protein [Ignavibacteriales bacterium]
MENKQLTKLESFFINNFIYRIVIIIALAFAILVVQKGHVYLLPAPSAIAGGITIQSGLNAFYGLSSAMPWSASHTASLLIILFYYLLIPMLFMKSLQAWFTLSTEEKNTGSVRGPFYVLVVSSAFCLSLLYFSCISLYTTSRINDKLSKSAYNQTETEIFVQNLMTIALQAQEYYYLPLEKGGGNRTWRTIETADGTTRNFSIDEAWFNHTQIPARMQISPDILVSKNVYIQKPSEVDTVLSFVAVSGVASTNKNFANEDGCKGMKQWNLKITPHDYAINLVNP